MFTGQAKRDELASELSDKLYAGRADSGHHVGARDRTGETGRKASRSRRVRPATGGWRTNRDGAPAHRRRHGASTVNAQPGAKLPTKQGAPAGASPAKNASDAVRDALLGRVLEKAKANPELTLVPIVIFGMLIVHLFRRRRSPEDDFILPDLSALIPSEAETYEMTHPVHALEAEDFELLVALIYQRQGYRVTMPAGQGGGDFIVQRKSERLLVQCKKLKPDYKVHVDRVRELHEAAVEAGVTRGVYVAPCGFSWDARNFAKVKGVTAINARMLDALLTAARETPDEDILSVSTWAPKLLKKVKLTPPLCPACEATMDEVSASLGSVWLCSQRPECRGRRTARNFNKPTPAASAKVDAKPKPQAAPTAPSPEEPPPPAVMGGRARTICPSPPSDAKAKPQAPPQRENLQEPVKRGRRPREIFSPASSGR